MGTGGQRTILITIKMDVLTSTGARTAMDGRNKNITQRALSLTPASMEINALNHSAHKNSAIKTGGNRCNISLRSFPKQES